MTTAKRKMRKRIREAQRQAQAMKHGGKKIFRKNRNGGPIVVEDVKYNKTIETTAAVPEAPKMTTSTFPLNYTMTVQTPNVESFSMTFDPNKAPLPPEPTQKIEKMPVPDFTSGMPLPESTPVQKEQKKMASTQTRTKPKTSKTASVRTKTGAKKPRPFTTLGKAKGVSLLEVGKELHLPKTLGQRKETAVKIARRTRQNAQKQMSRLEMFAKAVKKERYMNGAIETYQRRNDIVAQLSRVLNGPEGGILNSADFIYRYNQNFGNLIKSLQPKINGKRQYIGITKAYANPEYLRMYNAFLGRPADMPVDKKEFNEAFRGKTVKQLMANYQGKEQELAGKEPNISTRKIRVTIPKRKIYIKRQQRANQKMAEREALPKLVENTRANRLTLPKAPTRRDWLNLAGTALNRYPVLKKVALWAVIAGTVSLGLGAGHSSPVAETNVRQTEPSVTHVQTASPTMEQTATMTQAPEVAQASMQAEMTEATTTPAPEVEAPAVEMTETMATETPTVEPEMTEATTTPAPEVEAAAVETTETVATETPTVEPEMTEATPTPAPEVEAAAVETTETMATETPTLEPEMTEATPTSAPEVEAPAVEMTETVATETPTVEPETTETTATEVEKINAEIKSFQDKWEEYRAQREADDWNKFQEINKDRLSYINGLKDPELLKKESEAFRKDWYDYWSANEKLYWMQFQEKNKEWIETTNRSYDEIAQDASPAASEAETPSPEEVVSVVETVEPETTETQQSGGEMAETQSPEEVVSVAETTVPEGPGIMARKDGKTGWAALNPFGDLKLRETEQTSETSPAASVAETQSPEEVVSVAETTVPEGPGIMVRKDGKTGWAALNPFGDLKRRETEQTSETSPAASEAETPSPEEVASVAETPSPEEVASVAETTVPEGPGIMARKDGKTGLAALNPFGDLKRRETEQTSETSPAASVAETQSPEEVASVAETTVPEGPGIMARKDGKTGLAALNPFGDLKRRETEQTSETSPAASEAETPSPEEVASVAETPSPEGPGIMARKDGKTGWAALNPFGDVKFKDTEQTSEPVAETVEQSSEDKFMDKEESKGGFWQGVMSVLKDLNPFGGVRWNGIPDSEKRAQLAEDQAVRKVAAEQLGGGVLLKKDAVTAKVAEMEDSGEADQIRNNFRKIDNAGITDVLSKSSAAESTEDVSRPKTQPETNRSDAVKNLNNVDSVAPINRRGNAGR